MFPNETLEDQTGIYKSFSQKDWTSSSLNLKKKCFLMEVIYEIK